MGPAGCGPIWKEGKGHLDLAGAEAPSQRMLRMDRRKELELSILSRRGTMETERGKGTEFGTLLVEHLSSK